MANRLKILIVEDESAIATVMAILLNEAGCETSVVHNGKAGIELALEKEFDLIALDIDLPDINGFDICKKIKQQSCSRQTPVVFVSGNDCAQRVQRGVELGAVDFIAKPFGMDFASRLLSHIKTKTDSTVTLENAI